MILNSQNPVVFEKKRDTTALETPFGAVVTIDQKGPAERLVIPLLHTPFLMAQLDRQILTLTPDVEPTLEELMQMPRELIQRGAKLVMILPKHARVTITSPDPSLGA